MGFSGKYAVYENIHDWFDKNKCSGLPISGNIPFCRKMNDIICVIYDQLNYLPLKALWLFLTLPIFLAMYIPAKRLCKRENAFFKKNTIVVISLPSQADWKNIGFYKEIFRELEKSGADIFAILIDEGEIYARMDFSQMPILRKKFPWAYIKKME